MATWDITSASYDQEESVNAKETNPSGVFFKPDGSEMYVVGNTSDAIHQYNLGTNWDVTTASFDSTTSVAASNPQDVFFSADGTEMYISEQSNSSIYQYTLSTPWDLSSSSHTRTEDISGDAAAPRAAVFNTDGSKFYSLSNGGIVSEWDASTAWNIGTITHVRDFDASGKTNFSVGFWFNPDGSQFFIEDSGNDEIYEYNLGTPWNVSTAAWNATLDISGTEIGGFGIYIKADGSLLFLTGSIGGGNISQWDMTPPAAGTNTQINIGDAWKDVSGIQINIGDVWKDVTKVEVNVGDAWKTVF